MIHKYEPERMTFRAVAPEDKPVVLAFTARTWGEEGDDYIAEVFDDWVDQVDAHFTAVLYEGQVVGIAHLLNQGDGEYWLEGLRIDPAYRDRGIGWALHNYNLELLQKLGARVIRYATGEKNAISQKFALHSGFHLVDTYRRYSKTPEKNDNTCRKLEPDQFTLLLPILPGGRWQQTGMIFQYDWTWQILTEERLLQHINHDHVFGRFKGELLTAWAIYSLEDSAAAQVYFFDGIAEGELRSLLFALENLTIDAGAEEIRIRLPGKLADGPLLEEMGYVPGDSCLLVFEREL